MLINALWTVTDIFILVLKNGFIRENLVSKILHLYGDICITNAILKIQVSIGPKVGHDEGAMGEQKRFYRVSPNIKSKQILEPHEGTNVSCNNRSVGRVNVDTRMHLCNILLSVRIPNGPPYIRWKYCHYHYQWPQSVLCVG